MHIKDKNKLTLTGSVRWDNKGEWREILGNMDVFDRDNFEGRVSLLEKMAIYTLVGLLAIIEIIGFLIQKQFPPQI